ncbi:hypothetical protein BT96DRAFT_916660 [Gymnopus androsaceus JB14]|uniref:Uncharacterized protein n=1 Tax=Gymnopus androsaceus JB14 TaxID=1447944 RepID=A0A6A4I5T8_9AGAR|nr:hypothetical protein BT96DRAFT_916660 [Gymnopus androsaceus JB14]
MHSTAASDIYARLLLPHSHGYPFWIPEPNEALPTEYINTGISVGDLGLVRQDGGFDFLFNIFLKADNKINNWLGKGLPEGYEPIPKDNQQFYRNSNQFSPGALGTLGNRKIELDAKASVQMPLGASAGGEINFELTRSEGALLMLPKGAERVDYQNHSAVRDYAFHNARRWYEYVNGCLGREAQIGSLYLVTGHDKTSAWEVAAWSSASLNQTVSINFTPGAFGDGNLRLTESSRLQSFLPNRHSKETKQKNQTVFVRGFKISVRQNRFWDMPQAEPKVMKITDMSPRDVMHRGRTFRPSVPLPPRFGRLREPDDSAHSSDALPPPSNASSGSIQQRSSNGGDTDSDSLAQSYSSSASSTSSNSSRELLESMMYHPSNIINDYMLEKYPNADVAITHDNDWCSILNEVRSNFIERIQRKYSICDDGSGYVYLTPKTHLHALVDRLQSGDAQDAQHINHALIQPLAQEAQLSSSFNRSPVVAFAAASFYIDPLPSTEPGTRVMYITARGQTVQGTVLNSFVSPDGTLMLHIRPDGGAPITLPAKSCVKI